MIGLVGGPTEAEHAAGYTSFFSEQTELAVLGVAIDDDGTATVDFADFRAALSNASTSAGTKGFLSQLNATVFQVEEVTAVIYRNEGSCDVFWRWLQSMCTVISRD
jgi:sporulation and spore germination protein